MKRIRAIVYGVGKQGKAITRLMVEKGIEVVGAIGHVSNVGKDLGEVAGLGYALNVIISSDAHAVLREQEADVVVMSFCSDIDTMYLPAKNCIEQGMNVISIAENAFYPWTTSPVLASRLDKLAKKYDVTVFVGGGQDLFWVNLISTLCATSNSIESISGRSTFSLNAAGRGSLEYYGIGKTAEEFRRIAEERMKNGMQGSMFGQALEALIASFGLTLKKKEQRIEPAIAEEDVDCRPLNRVVKKGEVIGFADVAEISTQQGPRLRGEVVCRIYKEGEVDTNEWEIKGDPDLHLVNQKFPVHAATYTMAVTRIPDVINGEPGFVTVDQLPKIAFRPFPLHYYLRS